MKFQATHLILVAHYARAERIKTVGRLYGVLEDDLDDLVSLVLDGSDMASALALSLPTKLGDD